LASLSRPSGVTFIFENVTLFEVLATLPPRLAVVVVVFVFALYPLPKPPVRFTSRVLRWFDNLFKIIN
jgi:hypothetical protein